MVDLLYDDIELRVEVPNNNQDKSVVLTSDEVVSVSADPGFNDLGTVSITPRVLNTSHYFTENGVFNITNKEGYVGIHTVKCFVDVTPSYPISSVYLTSIPDYLHDPHGNNKIVRSFTNLSNFEVISGFVDVSDGSGVRLFCNNGVFGGIRPSYTGLLVCFGLDNTSDPSYPDTITVSVKNVAGSKNIPMSSYSLGLIS